MSELFQPNAQEQPALRARKAPSSTAREAELRKRLGIPQDASRVLVLGESSHWDPNWLLTSDEYYRARVEKILDQALAALAADPARVYSVESVFFLRMYYLRREKNRGLLRQMLNERRLRLIGGAISSPDTLVTPVEGLLRDYLLGAEWLRSVGVTQTARVAYFPDNFGHSPSLPSLLRAVSVPYAGITRIDGMYFPGTDYRDAGDYPLRGSSAERLLRDERSLSFRWQARDQSEVLCHWNAFGYGQGDLLGHVGLTRWMGLPLAKSARSTSHVVKQIDHLAAQLTPLSRTPYLFCPIGFDFVSPLVDLSGLIREYNGTAYADTGTFVLNAGLDDYFDLVACRSADLPALSLDPNPYWMGFYASRPQLKRSHWELVERVTQLEARGALQHAKPEEAVADGPKRLESIPESIPSNAPSPSLLSDIWHAVAFSNHHDFVTGTSPDRVFFNEQRPLLRDAHAALDEASSAPATSMRAEPVPRGPGLTVMREGSVLWVDNGLLAVGFDEARGGTIREVRDLEHGETLLGAGSLDLTVDHDGGGLWRMGHEFRGGRYSRLNLASERRAQVDCDTAGEALSVSLTCVLEGHVYVRTCRLGRGSRFLWLSACGDAEDDRTVSARFQLPWLTASASMGCAGGVVTRASTRHYSPTFWPVQSFVHWTDTESQRGFVLFPRGTASVSFDAQGSISQVVQRTARLERAWGVLPLLGFPAAGRERGAHKQELALTFTRHGDWRRNHLPALAHAATHGHEQLAKRHIIEQLTVDDDRVTATAFKRASNGLGYIVRLLAPQPPEKKVTLSMAGYEITSAFRCDALERDLGPLEVTDGALRFEQTHGIESVRLELKSRA